MKYTIDTDAQTFTLEGDGDARTHGLYTQEAFDALSRQWVRVGWSLRYYHSFSCMGRPILQLPEDLVRMQEAFHQVQPDLVIETGVFEGGSLVYHATLCEALGKGRVVGVDVEVRPGVREALQSHRLAPRITLIEGDSADPAVVDQVRGLQNAGDTTLVLLDSDHSRDHVRRELEAYAPLVTPGSYLVVADGIMRDLSDVPGGEANWRSDNPLAAADDFLAGNSDFERARPPRPSQDGPTTDAVTYWPDGWLRRL